MESSSSNPLSLNVRYYPFSLQFKGNLTLQHLRQEFPRDTANYATSETDNDSVYIFKIKNHEEIVSFHDDMKKIVYKPVIAGSSAMYFLLKYLKQEKQFNLMPGDHDIFFFNCPQAFHQKLGEVDLIASPCKDVAELFDSFDLPCCRVAYNDEYLWISQKAIMALIWHGRTLISRAFLERNVFEAACKKYSIPNLFRDRMWELNQARLTKYRSRGFEFLPTGFKDEYPMTFHWYMEFFQFYDEDGYQNRPVLLTPAYNQVKYSTHSFANFLAGQSLFNLRDEKLQKLLPNYIQYWEEFMNELNKNEEEICALKAELLDINTPVDSIQTRLKLLERINKLERLHDFRKMTKLY